MDNDYKPTGYIAIENLEHGSLYKIKARNSRIGIWDWQMSHFIISRYKFSSNFISYEYHWDQGPPFGTVLPLRLICKVPRRILPIYTKDGGLASPIEMKLLNYLNQKQEEIDGRA